MYCSCKWIPSQAGNDGWHWIPAFAGMTGKERGNDEWGGGNDVPFHTFIKKSGSFLALFPFKSTKPTLKVGFGLIAGKGSSFDPFFSILNFRSSPFIVIIRLDRIIHGRNVPKNPIKVTRLMNDYLVYMFSYY